MMRITSFSVAIFLLSLCIGIGSFVSADLVGDICAKSRNPSFCLDFFKSDHSATLVNLGIKSIDRARSSAGDTKKLIDSLVKGTTDPSLKSKYRSCSDNYDDAVSNLDDARKSLNDPSTLNIKVSAAMTDVDTCEDGIGKTAVNPKLKDGNDFLTNVCSVALVISNLL